MDKSEFIISSKKDAESYIVKCWEFRHFYKKEEEKILYFAGTLFTTIVATAGVLDVYSKINLGELTVYHIILFHSLFFILLLFYLYKQLNCEIFNSLALNGEDFLDKNIREFIVLDTSLPVFSNVKSGYLDNKKKGLHGIWLTNVANYLIVLTYSFITIFPFFLDTKSDGKCLTLPYKAIIPAICFIVLLIISFVFKKVQKEKVVAQIKIDWENESVQFKKKLSNLNE